MSGAETEFSGTERFEIKRRLGVGGMGVVYEALDRERDELVALKCIRRFDPRGLLRFKKEFRALHDISHPNLVSLGELLEADGEWFFTMELIRGADFLAHVRPGMNTRRAGESHAKTDIALAATDGSDGAARSRRSAVPSTAGVTSAYDEPKLRESLKQLARAIAAVHAAGKVHRDIKPSNVLVSSEGRVVLLDFGLVAVVDRDRGSSQANVVGTAEYMAPEQALSGQVAPSADWYSVGTMLYEALTGRLPHRGGSALAILMAKQQRTPTPPRAHRSDIPGDLDELCMDLLRLEPGQRPSEAEILERLGVEARTVPRIRRAATSTGITQASPFVGRDAELAELHQAFDRSLEAAHIAVLTGPSGLGKTRLMHQFIESIQAQYPDVVVLHSRCYERESVAYKAFDGIADDLSRHLARLPNTEAAALLPLRAGLLPRLFQVLQRVEAIARAPKEPSETGAHEQRRRMFGAFRELFMRLAKRHPVVLCIDDLQWTDADSLILLQEVVADAETIPLLVLVTMRPASDADPDNLLAKVRAAAATTLVRLGELPHEQAQTLAGLLMPGKPDNLLQAVARETSGHPLFIHELVRHLDSNPSERASTLDEALLSRIARLPPDVRTLLEVVCVAGSPIAHGAAAAAAEMDAASQAKATRALRVAFLVRTDGVRKTDTIVAYHDRIRVLVQQQLDAAETRHWHSRLALALEQLGAAKSDPQALVHHAEAAGRSRRAAAYAAAAAVYAMDAMAFDQAADLFGTALRLGRYNDQARRALQIAQATALVNAGRGPEAAEGLMAAAVGADPATRLECKGQAAEQWIITGHIERGVDALAELLVDIGEPLARGPRRALASLLWHRFQIRARSRRFTIRAESQIAPEMLRRLDVLRTVALGFATMDNIRGADFNARFLLLAQRVGEPYLLLQAQGMEAVYRATQGGRAGRRGRLLLSDLELLAERCGDSPYARAWLSLIGGFVSYFEGGFRLAAELIGCAEDDFQSKTTGTTLERNNTRVFRFLSLRWMGSFGKCRQLAAQSVRDAEQRGDIFLATTLQLLSAHPAVKGRRADGGSHQMPNVKWAPPEGGFHGQHWFELEARGDLALFNGTVATVLQAQEPAFEALRKSLLLRVQIVRCAAHWLHARMLVAVALESPDPKPPLDRATALVRELLREGVDYAVVLALLVKAAIAMQGRKPDEAQAITSLRRAIELAESNHMAFHAAAAYYRLGGLIGGEEGVAAITRAYAWAAAEGVGDMNRIVELAAPGFPAA